MSSDPLDMISRISKARVTDCTVLRADSAILLDPCSCDDGSNGAYLASTTLASTAELPAHLAPQIHAHGTAGGRYCGIVPNYPGAAGSRLQVSVKRPEAHRFWSWGGVCAHFTGAEAQPHQRFGQLDRGRDAVHDRRRNLRPDRLVEACHPAAAQDDHLRAVLLNGAACLFNDCLDSPFGRALEFEYRHPARSDRGAVGVETGEQEPILDERHCTVEGRNDRVAV